MIIHELDDIAEFMYNNDISKEAIIMPNIKSSAELRNNYNGISKLCHEYNEPVFITKNGKGDLAVLSIEAYEQLVSKYELYSELEKGLQDINNGKTRRLEDAILDIRNRRKR